ncbi:Cyclin, C-terminal domain, partial [Dillenia turbinata]
HKEGKRQQKNVVEKGRNQNRRFLADIQNLVTSIRNKVNCGSTKRVKEPIIDIDAAEVNDELAVGEYVEELYKFYKLAEYECRLYDYMGTQPEINKNMRAIVVDWLIDVHDEFQLTPEILYLTIQILDRYLSRKMVPQNKLQLVGITAMLIACKYEGAPEVNDFVNNTDLAYSHQQVLVMEKSILDTLEWHLTVPTAYVFLARFIKAAIPDEQLENLVYFFAELGMINYETSIICCPSEFAASAVYAARCTLAKTPVWSKTLMLHTGFCEFQFKHCAKLLLSYHRAAAQGKLMAIYRKYSSSQRCCVSLLPPAESLV